jgi:hypothetical protein
MKKWMLQFLVLVSTIVHFNNSGLGSKKKIARGGRELIN